MKGSFMKIGGPDKQRKKLSFSVIKTKFIFELKKTKTKKTIESNLLRCAINSFGCLLD